MAVLYIVVFFALFYSPELNAPRQFADSRLGPTPPYFALITLGAVSYGDNHAVGRIARAATMVQVAFDLAVIGAELSD